MAHSKQKQWNPDTGPAGNAREQLPRIAEEYFAEVREALSRNPTPPQLHRVRLASKRFRYTLELFRPCYAAGLRLRIEALKQIQDLLGECNDAVASLPRIEKALRRPAERARMRQYLENLAAEKANAFRRHWVEDFDAEGRQEWWTRYLARNARPPVRAK